MTGDVERLRVGRDMLVEFALGAIAWIDEPSDDLRSEHLIYGSQLVAPHTGVPHGFEEFAHRLEQQRTSGSETR